MESIYHRLGEQNLSVMVDNFYHYVMEDDTINHLFTTDMELVKKKTNSISNRFSRWTKYLRSRIWSSTYETTSYASYNH